jgi:HEAT repeat protein
VAQLAPLATDPDSQVRQAVAAALCSVPSDESAALLGNMVNDSDSAVRRAIAYGLRKNRHDGVVAILAQLLKEPDKRVRLEVVHNLGLFKNTSSLEALELALKDSDADVKQAAGKAIGAIGTEAAVGILTRGMDDPDNKVRRAVATGIPELPQDKMLPILSKAMAHSDADVRLICVPAIKRLDDKAALPLLLKAAIDKHDWVRLSAIEKLRTFKDPSGLPALEKLLAEAPEDSRLAIIQAIGNIGGKQATNILQTQLSHPDHDVRYNAILQLTRDNPKQHKDLIFRAVEDKDCLIRLAAMTRIRGLDEADQVAMLEKTHGDTIPQIVQLRQESVAGLHSVESKPSLKSLLTQKDSSLSSSALQALCRFHDDDALRAIADALGSQESRIECELVDALSTWGSERAYAALVFGLYSKDSSVVQRAADAIWESQDKNAFNVLARAFKGGGVSTRRGVVLSMRKCHDERTLPLLESAVEDEDYQVRGTAADLLPEHDISPGKKVELVSKTIDSDDQNLRMLGMRLLYGLDGEAAWKHIQSAMESKHDDVRVSVIGLLPRYPKEDVLPILKSALGHNRHAIREAAAKCLGKIGNADEAVVSLLATAVQDKESLVRAVAAKSLAGKGGDRARDLLIEAVKKETSPFTRDTMISALRRTWPGDTKVAAALKTLTDNEHGAPAK